MKRHNPYTQAREWLTHYLGCKHKIMKIKISLDDVAPVLRGQPAQRSTRKDGSYFQASSLRIHVGIVWLEDHLPLQYHWREMSEAKRTYFETQLKTLGVTTSG